MNHHNVKLILASQSPRRRRLLLDSGYNFEVIVPDDDVERAVDQKMSPAEIVVQSAILKAQFVAQRIRADETRTNETRTNETRTNETRADETRTNETRADQIGMAAAGSERTIVLAADTLAHCDGKILGKPQSRDDAKRMLQLMSGRPHAVLTGVCLWIPVSGKHQSWLEVTSLRMDDLSENLIDEYLESNQWQGKAGAFGYQDGLDWVHIESGLASTVVGLPVERLAGWIAEIQKL